MKKLHHVRLKKMSQLNQALGSHETLTRKVHSRIQFNFWNPFLTIVGSSINAIRFESILGPFAAPSKVLKMVLRIFVPLTTQSFDLDGSLER